MLTQIKFTNDYFYSKIDLGDFLLKKILIFLIRVYQITPLSSHCFCRCTPSCSEYMIEAISYYGVRKGLYLGMKRIIQCRPGGIYGYQPLRKENEI